MVCCALEIPFYLTMCSTDLSTHSCTEHVFIINCRESSHRQGKRELTQAGQAPVTAPWMIQAPRYHTRSCTEDLCATTKLSITVIEATLIPWHKIDLVLQWAVEYPSRIGTQTPPLEQADPCANQCF